MALATALSEAWNTEQVFTHPSYDVAWLEEVEDELTVEAIDYAFRKMWKASMPRVFVALNQDLPDGPG